MPKKKKQTKPVVEDDDLEVEATEKVTPGDAEPAADADSDDDYDLSGVPSVADFNTPNEPDPREVDTLTDRIFDSVLSRFGWKSQDGRIEHVGETSRTRR